MVRRPNLKNFFYLVGSGLLIQLAGTFYRIWLARRIGPGGLGILQMVYPVYRLLSSMATIGLPLALTKWISEYLVNRDFLRITALKNWAVRIVCSSSLIIACLLGLSVSFLSHHVFTDNRVEQALLIIAVAIPFSALSAIYRGYFQGFSNMAPTAASEITEQIAEISTVVLGISLLVSLLPLGAYSIPVLGLTVGEMVCLLTLLVFMGNFHYNKKNGLTETTCYDLPHPEILHYSWPLLINQIVSLISLASEGVIIPNQLIAVGYSISHSTELFGTLTGMAEPVAFFPLIFLAPLATVLSPQVSAAVKDQSLPKLLHKIKLFYTAGIFMCCSSFLMIMNGAGPLTQFLYNSAAPSQLIRLLVISLPFSGLAILNITILAALGATAQILVLSLWSVGLKTFLFFALTPWLGISGAAWAIIISQIFIALASWSELRRVWPGRFPKIYPRFLRLCRSLRPVH